MASSGKWIQSANKRMKAKGTVGSLTAIAKRDGGVKKNGDIKVSWMRKKMASKKTSPAVKKKINFALNVRK